MCGALLPLSVCLYRVVVDYVRELISALETVSILRLSHVRSRLRPCFALSGVYVTFRTAGQVSGTHKPLRRSKAVVLFQKPGGKRDLDQRQRRCQDQTIQTRKGSLAQTLTEGRGPSDNKDSACRILISRILSCGSIHDGLCQGILVHQFLHNAFSMPSFFFAYRE